jgi:tRNA threonylcarbamoyl adenosine modification protein YeaZ
VTISSGSRGSGRVVRLGLAVTSSTSVVGVAVGPLGGPPAEAVRAEVPTDRRHAEELTPLVGEVLRRSGATMTDLDCFVVDVGPGRFTGLRVGLATIRSLALATGRGVIGLASLEILAGAEPIRPLVVAIDARRGEVFQQRFGPDGEDSEPVVGPPAELAAAVDGIVAVGDGADRYADLYGPELLPGRHPSAAVMLALAADQPAVGAEQARPRYLRDPDVHINVKTRHSPR